MNRPFGNFREIFEMPQLFDQRPFEYWAAQLQGADYITQFDQILSALRVFPADRVAALTPRLSELCLKHFRETDRASRIMGLFDEPTKCEVAKLCIQGIAAQTEGAPDWLLNIADPQAFLKSRADRLWKSIQLQSYDDEAANVLKTQSQPRYISILSAALKYPHPRMRGFIYELEQFGTDWQSLTRGYPYVNATREQWRAAAHAALPELARLSRDLSPELAHAASKAYVKIAGTYFEYTRCPKCPSDVVAVTEGIVGAFVRRTMEPNQVSVRCTWCGHRFKGHFSCD